jgi:cytochrome c2
MKKALKIIGILMGSVIALILIGALFISARGIPSYEPEQLKLKVVSSPERVEQGLRLASMLCMHCHKGPDGKLDGRKVEDTPPQFGISYAANITQHPTAGIGDWTDGELVYFLRTGIKPDGSFAPFMPRLPKMSDEDLYSIVAFLHSDHPSVQPSEKPSKESEFTFFSKFLATVAMKPAPLPEGEVVAPDSTDPVARGKYIIDGQMACFACHSADFATNNEVEPNLSVGYLGGGNALLNLEGEVVISSNLTMHEASGLGTWTEEEFVDAVKWGKKPDGSGTYAYPMLPYTALPESDVRAIWAYLQTVPVLAQPERQ